jgi:hypothetical protein
MLSGDGRNRVGSVTIAHLPDRDAADAMVRRDPLVVARLPELEVHRWRFDGRPANILARERVIIGGQVGGLGSHLATPTTRAEAKVV